MARVMTGSLVVLLALTCAGAASGRGQPAQVSPQAPSTETTLKAWRSFEATLTASGRRDTLDTEDGRTAVVLHVSGTLFVTRSDGLGRGLRAEFLGFDDGSGTGTARAVWTDDEGNRIFSRMVGAELATGRRVAATITGGTGRFAGITGTYTFTWQYVLPGEQGVTQVRVVSMKGRYRMEPPR